jgi:hypothetical protein
MGVSFFTNKSFNPLARANIVLIFNICKLLMLILNICNILVFLAKIRDTDGTAEETRTHRCPP